jgi:hypothetical protein
MWCCKCNRDLSECVCPDINERLAGAVDGGQFIYRKCLKCGEHYTRCKCAEPEWVFPGAEKKPETKR